MLGLKRLLAALALAASTLAGTVPALHIIATWKDEVCNAYVTDDGDDSVIVTRVKKCG